MYVISGLTGLAGRAQVLSFRTRLLGDNPLLCLGGSNRGVSSVFEGFAFEIKIKGQTGRSFGSMESLNDRS